MRTNGSHFSGTASSGVIASTGHSGSHAPQSMHSSGSMTSMRAPSWMQSTGQTSMQDLSLMSMHGSLITYVMPSRSDHGETGAAVAEAHLEVEPVGRDREAELARADRMDGELLERPPGERRERVVELARRVREVAPSWEPAEEPERGLLASRPVDRAQASCAEAE